MQKIKRLWQNKFFKNFIIFFISFLLIEVIFRSISHMSLISFNMVRIIIGLSILAFILGAISSLIPKFGSKIFNLLIILGVSVYAIAELGFKNYLGIFVSLQSSSQASAVTSYIGEYIRSFYWYYYLIFIPFILVVLYYLFIDKKICVDMPKKVKNMQYLIVRCFLFLMLCFLMLCYFGTLKLDFIQDKKQAVSAYDLFLKPNNPTLVVTDFGVMGFGLLDIKEYFFPGEEKDLDVTYDVNNIGNYTSGNANIPKEETQQTAIDNDIWIKIIDNEKDKNKNTLNKYFVSRDATYTNQYTGMFKDKNLIMVMIESGSNLLINEEYYPNITKLYKEGWHFNNYYSPRNTCSTINNEFSNLSGLYTINNNCTAKVYKDNVYFESLFNLFNEANYNTASFHDYTEKYYPRPTIHKNLGSGKYTGVQDLDIKYSKTYGNWPSDEDFIESYLNILDEQDTSVPFMHFLTTVTSHQPYVDDSTYNNLYKEEFPEEYSDDVRSYMSKIKVVDNAIGRLVDGLESRGLLDDTVIVLFADHYPYGINQKNLSTAYGYDATKDNEAEKVPYIIYNPEIESEAFPQYSAHVNTTPTMANLFDLNYDSRLYLGSDVLNPEYESLVIFDDGSWKNEVAFYDASSSDIKYYTDNTYTNEEILAKNTEISLKLKMSSLAIKSDYFNYLKKKLDSYSTSDDLTDDANDVKQNKKGIKNE